MLRIMNKLLMSPLKTELMDTVVSLYSYPDSTLECILHICEEVCEVPKMYRQSSVRKVKKVHWEMTVDLMRPHFCECTERIESIYRKHDLLIT
jgi:hypothetical protein